jgi:hypothetical protein
VKRVLLGVAAVALLNCASLNYVHPPLTPYKYDIYKYLRHSPCQKEKTEWAYRQLKLGKGCTECALYYFRCRELDEWKIQARRNNK